MNVMLEFSLDKVKPWALANQQVNTGANRSHDHGAERQSGSAALSQEVYTLKRSAQRTVSFTLPIPANTSERQTAHYSDLPLSPPLFPPLLCLTLPIATSQFFFFSSLNTHTHTHQSSLQPSSLSRKWKR